MVGQSYVTFDGSALYVTTDAAVRPGTCTIRLADFKFERVSYPSFEIRKDRRHHWVSVPVTIASWAEGQGFQIRDPHRLTELRRRLRRAA